MTTTTAPPGESARSKRARFAVMAAITLAALIAAALFANIIGEKRSTRFDLTATRAFTLAPRTEAVLAQVTEPIELVVSADIRSIDTRSMRQIRDVLDEFQRATDQLGITIIDTGSTASLPDFERVIAILAANNADDIEQHQTALERTEQGLRELAAKLPELAESLLTVAKASELADAENINTQALLIGEIARSCEVAADNVSAARAHSIANTNLPATDQAQAAAQAPFQNAIATAGAVQQWASEVAMRLRSTEGSALAAAPFAAQLASAAENVRDAGAAAFDELAHLAPLEPLQIARALQVTPAVLVIAPNGTTAINLESLFPVFADPDNTAGRAEVRFRGEELIATAISTLLLDDPPILVIVHAEQERLFDEVGRVVSPAAAPFASIIDRCRLRRMDVTEWAVHIDPARPALTDLNPSGTRPIVWFVPGAPTRLGLDRANGLAERALRVDHLAEALKTLINARANILLAIEPSELPGAGQPDLLIKPLEDAFGLTIATATPLIEQITMPDAIGISTYHTPIPVGDHPIAGALQNLKLALQWPMRIDIEQRGDTIVTPFLEMPANDAVWGESQWLTYRYANERRPFMTFTPRSPITKDADRDDASGPWTIGAAIERLAEPNSGDDAQRVVIITAPSWYEPHYEQQAQLEGRRITIYPGNTEVFDSALWWLSRLDGMIAPASTSRDVSRIAQLSSQQLSMWRWLLIAGLPALTLLSGIMYRVFRG